MMIIWKLNFEALVARLITTKEPHLRW